MTPEQTVCDRELARELKERGLPQEGWIWYWVEDCNWYLWNREKVDYYNNRICSRAYNSIPAPCTDELFEILPMGLTSAKTNSGTSLQCSFGWDKKICGYTTRDWWEITKDTKEANSRARGIIHLHDQGLLDLKEVKV